VYEGGWRGSVRGWRWTVRASEFESEDVRCVCVRDGMRGDEEGGGNYLEWAHASVVVDALLL